MFNRLIDNGFVIWLAMQINYTAAQENNPITSENDVWKFKCQFRNYVCLIVKYKSRTAKEMYWDNRQYRTCLDQLEIYVGKNSGYSQRR